MKNIILINTPTLPCPGSHYFTSSKFCRGFQHGGFNFLEINHIDDSLSLYNNSDNIFLISNHLTSYGGLEDVYRIGKLLPNAYFICWHFNFEKELINNMPFKKFIITGEHYFNPPLSSDRHIEAYNFSKSCKEWEPFIFSTDMNPNQVGNFTRNIIYDSFFIGYPYKSKWTSSLSNCYVFNSSGSFIPEETRISIYLSSRVCLGFHSDANIANSCVVERVFEGMSYGCAVISDNKTATEYTNNIVKYVNSYDEVVSYIDFYKQNYNEYMKLQQEGYEFIKQKGTYYHLSQNFINKLKYLYG